MLVYNYKKHQTLQEAVENFSFFFYYFKN